MAERKIILLLSGEIAAGKTTLAHKLEENFGFTVLKTRLALKELGKKKLKGNEPDRTFFQKYGRQLDKDNEGKWLLDYFQLNYGSDLDTKSFFVVDSIRIKDQLKQFRQAYNFLVFHIHLTASPQCLEERYMQREEVIHLKTEDATKKYELAKADPTEKHVPKLAEDADLNIDTELSTKDDVLIRIASFLKLLAPTKNSLVDVIIGGQFGSEGKGQIAAHISPEYDCLLRVGGPNAGHTVYEELFNDEGKLVPDKHVFHLLPSGSHRNRKAKLILGPGSIINVDTILQEIAKYHITDEFSERLIIDPNAIVISEADIKLEQQVKKTIGSTGQGVGAATANNLIARLYGDEKHKAKNNNRLAPFIGSTYETLEDLYRRGKKILLEGTQGTGLSIHHGIYPYVTSRDTTVSGCISEAGISPRRVNKIIMVARTYPIRVGGTSGPFVSKEIDLQTISDRSGKDIEELKSTEKTTTTKIDRRIAEFSWTMFRKSCELNSPTDIALTFTDYISSDNTKARRYDQLSTETRQFIEEIERCSGVKVSLISTSFDYRAIIDRRNW